MRVLYCGISGVGKDSLLTASAEFLRTQEATVTSFADEMLICGQRERPGFDRDGLKHLPVETQRRLASDAIDSIARFEGRLIVNSHLVIEGVDADAQDTDTVLRMSANGIICVKATPECLLERRLADHARRREPIALSQIEDLQGLQLEMALLLGQAVGIEVGFLDNSGLIDEGATQLRTMLTEMWSRYET